MSADDTEKGGKYDGLTRDQLVQLLEKRDRQKKLGLVWERNEIEADRTLEAEFVAADLLTEKSDPPGSTSGWQNLVIEGDNYDALRWLRMTMAGKIKCIYVDPPYNTGAKDWVYNDHYVSKEDRWRHSTWLEFLYRRFSLARDLLTEDGVLLVPSRRGSRRKAMHDLPLTPYDDAGAWAEQESDEAIVILVERVDDALVTRLKALAARRAPAFVYAWAPGQVTSATGPIDLEVRPVRDTLVSRFRT